MMANTSPTIYDVASLANVSVATISRHINGSARLDPSTQERVEKAIAELGYVPNSTAQRLSSGKSMIIGLAFLKDFVLDNVPGIERESMLFIDTVLRGIEMESSERNYSVLISFVEDEFDQRLDALQRMVGNVDGIIALESVFTPDVVSRLEQRLPLVVLAGDASSDHADTVHSANDAAMRTIAEHLITVHGVKRAGFVSGRLRSSDARARRDAFLTSFRELGGTVDEGDILDGDWSVSSGARAMLDRLERGDALPEVMVCANDQMAYGAMGVARSHGIRVPEDLKFTGFDDTPISQLMSPPLTTVRQDTFGMGREAVRLLVDAMANPQRAKKLVAQPTHFVPRESCGCGEGKGMNVLREMVTL
jgi:LacI family transcriptional regulator